jgi:hypothetical protein
VLLSVVFVRVGSRPRRGAVWYASVDPLRWG